MRLYLTEPDYTKPHLVLTDRQEATIKEQLAFLYGREKAATCFEELKRILGVHFAYKTPEMIAWDHKFDPASRFTGRDIILITYGDLICNCNSKKPPLQALSDFFKSYLKGAINTVHILPFFPYCADRGFSVIDFEQVDPNLGTWEDIEQLGMTFRLMFDVVFNHAGCKSRWFQEFLDGNSEYKDFFISFSTKDAISEDDLRLIMRPRPTDILTPFDTIDGKKYLWTTFSPHQIDLNFKNEKVLLRLIAILLMYVRRGANLFRLDAVPFLWHQLGTRSVHLKQTHIIVQLFRSVLNVVAPQVALVTETNVPHEDNLRYFGNGTNEAQMIYNFALAPLVLHTFQNANCNDLSQWADSLDKVSDTATYFNILDCHDGIPLLPVKNILSEDQINDMISQVKEHEGLVSYRSSSDGSQSPYEMNITWFSALNREGSDESTDLQIDRFIASRAIALALMGVPGIYLPGLLGSKNDMEAVLNHGGARSINRRTICAGCLLSNTESITSRIAQKFGYLIEKRIEIPAFHPNAAQRIIHVSDAVFTLVRETKDRSQTVIALTNVTARNQRINIPGRDAGRQFEAWEDILTGERVTVNGNGILSVALKPYQVMWLSI